LGSNPRKLSVVIAIAATLIIASALILSPHLVQSQQGKHISGSGHGLLHCGNARTDVGASLTFFAREEKGTVTRGFSIETEEGFPRFGSRPITGGHITGEKSYTLTGTHDQAYATAAPRFQRKSLLQENVDKAYL
jgi:hypothetical protein